MEDLTITLTADERILLDCILHNESKRVNSEKIKKEIENLLNKIKFTK